MRRSTPALKFLSTGGVIDIDIDIENASAGRLWTGLYWQAARKRRSVSGNSLVPPKHSFLASHGQVQDSGRC